MKNSQDWSFMVRDKLKDSIYWQEAVSKNDTMLSYLQSRLDEKRETGNPKASIAASSLMTRRFERCLLDYSMGNDIGGISAEAKSTLCDWYPEYMHSNPPGSKFSIERPLYTEVNRFFAILVLAKAEPIEAKRFTTAYDMWDYQGPPVPGHRDWICEEFAKYLVPDRDARKGTGVNWPEAYENLWKSIAPATDDAHRVQFLSDFLEDWYDLMKSELSAETGRHKQKEPDYVGYWCLEAAAASVMAGIDDSSFRNHRYYPADWADWARAQER